MAIPTTFTERVSEVMTDATPADKVRMLSSLVEYRSRLENDRKEADLKEWDRRFKEEQTNARKRADVVQKIYDRWAKGETDLSIADKRLLSTAMRAAMGGGGGKKAASGESLFRGWLKKEGATAEQNVGDPGSYTNAFAAKPTILENLRDAAALPAESPIRPWITQHVLDLGLWKPEDLRKQIGERMWQAYLDGITPEDRDDSQSQALVAKIETGSLTKPDLEAIKEKAMAATDVKPEDIVRPSSAPSELEAELADITKSVMGEEASATGPGRWYGLTDEQLGDMMARPGLRRWARDHGFADPGAMEGITFVPGKDTDRMLRAIIHQRKHPVQRFGDDVEAEVEVVDPGRYTVQKFITGDIKDGKLNSAWAVSPNGAIEQIDLVTKKRVPVKDAAGRWLSTTMRDQYLTDVERDPAGGPHPLGRKGEVPMGAAELLHGGPVDLVGDESFTGVAEEMLAPRPERVVVSGKKRLPTYGEDPDLVMHLRQPDGSLITLRRPNEEAAWQVNTEETPIGIFRPAKQKPDIAPEDLPEAGDVAEEKPLTSEELGAISRRARLRDFPNEGAEPAVAEEKPITSSELAAISRRARARDFPNEGIVYDDTEPRPPVTDSAAFKKDEAKEMKRPDRAEAIARRKVGAPPSLTVVVDDFADVPEYKKPAGDVAEEKAKRAAAMTAKDVEAAGAELAAAGAAAVDAEKAKRDAAIIAEMGKRASARAHEKELEEAGLAAVEGVKSDRLRAEREAAQAKERSGIVARREAADLADELEREGAAAVEAARKERETENGQPVRIVPKEGGSVALEALRRARGM